LLPNNMKETMKLALFVAALSTLTCAAAVYAASPAAPERPPATDPVALGRYIVTTAGCNDCHTPGYGAAGGRVPQKDWLTGDKLGWHGPWGTTYPTNLRLHLQKMTEAEWLTRARTMEPRPPMPWFNMRAMSDEDLKALYAFIKAAGPAGEPAPAYLPPGQAPKPPFVQFPQ
jgi:mono/diheme cytochrome c family protein